MWNRRRKGWPFLHMVSLCDDRSHLCLWKVKAKPLHYCTVHQKCVGATWFMWRISAHGSKVRRTTTKESASRASPQPSSGSMRLTCDLNESRIGEMTGATTAGTHNNTEVDNGEKNSRQYKGGGDFKVIFIKKQNRHRILDTVPWSRKVLSLMSTWSSVSGALF